MRLHILEGVRGAVAIDAASVVGIVSAESPIGEHSAVLLAGGHRVVVEGSVGEIYALLSRPAGSPPRDADANPAAADAP